MFRLVSIGLVISAISVAPLPSNAHCDTAEELSKVPASAEMPFGSVDDVWSFCGSSIKQKIACDVVSSIIR